MSAMRSTARRVWAFIRRVIRAGRRLATDKSLPVWLRVLFIIGCIQIPVLPFDEIALVAAVAITAVFHRSALRAAWAD